MAVQAVYKSGNRSAATARRLIASTTIAPHVLRETICDERFAGREVAFCTSHEVIEVGNVVILPEEKFYIIASKFVNRFYVMTRNAYGAWQSSGGVELQAKHLQMVKRYVAARKAAKVAA